MGILASFLKMHLGESLECANPAVQTAKFVELLRGEWCAAVRICCGRVCGENQEGTAWVAVPWVLCFGQLFRVLDHEAIGKALRRDRYATEILRPLKCARNEQMAE